MHDRLSSLNMRWRADFGVLGVFAVMMYLASMRPDLTWSTFNAFDDEMVSEDGLIPLPSPYTALAEPSQESTTCAERFGTLYIRAFSDSATEYCNNETTARLTCFSHKSHDERVDSFCVAEGATVEPKARTIEMQCPLRELDQQHLTRHAVPLEEFPQYWYNTGAGTIFDEYINLDSSPAMQAQETVERTVLLVKREETVDNPWHTLMQVMSLWLSLDVIRTTMNPATQRPFYSKHDLAGTQVVILDQWDDGPFFELWNMFGGIPAARFADVDPLSLSAANVIVPLPGGSNTLWQGDWEDLNCNDSVLLRAFSRRMLDYHGIAPPPKPIWGHTVKLLFIDRRGQRGLDNQQALFAALQANFPNVQAELVDFAELSMAEQLRRARSADILAGVHGAGLTHGMFLAESPKSTIVEILPPDLEHRGFKNMAKLLGHRYLSTHGHEQWYEGQSGDWHRDKVFIEEDRFLTIMGDAIEGAVG